MLVFKSEEELATYVKTEVAKTLQGVTRVHTTSLRRKNRPWEDWEDVYIVDTYRTHKMRAIAATLNRTLATCRVRLCMLRKKYGLPHTVNKNGRVFTFKLT